ncbi:MAG: tRNA (adenosine(37)-N6)-threonylcarbamoyltransferase complex transferase subunit TsaD [Candidatus Gracilibacteria bacterium]|nr:tRNA (adenosine(37)-N6)-threonylcarbamoyltransferase complex transferase subunit TsaD [Candidatus Gracilibacteria bacterium]
MLVLSIETSCDETSVAIVRDGREVLSNVIASQIDLHQKTGGVVPEVAAREHVLRIQECISKSCRDAQLCVSTADNIDLRECSRAIDLIAVTQGPGLIGCLLVGLNTAKTLSYVHKIPLLGVNHVEGHIYANFLERDPEEFQFPILVLTVSGGHNELILMRDHVTYELVGESIDDAAGEAFDKVARILGLGYPGGPVIEKAALKFEGEASIIFPRAWGIKGNTNPSSKLGMEPQVPDFNFSFSGLKTAALQEVEKSGLGPPEADRNSCLPDRQAELAKSFQEAVIDALATKTLQAALKYGVKEVHLAGGVSANTALRTKLEEFLTPHKINFKFPKNFSYCTDNAAMIAAAAYYRVQKEAMPDLDNWEKLKADPGLVLH